MRARAGVLRKTQGHTLVTLQRLVMLPPLVMIHPHTRWELRKTKGVGETDFHKIVPDSGEEIVVSV